MIKKYLTGVATAAALLLSASVANAATASFTSGNGTHVGNTYEFTGSDGTDVTASVLSGGDWSGGTLQQFGGGLGICSSTRQSGSCREDHEVDGSQGNEAVRLTFESEVYLNTIYFDYVGSNDDFNYRVDGGSWGYEDIVGPYHGNDGHYTFSLPGLLGTVFDIAAWYSNDDFKLRGVEYTAVSAVPLPPAVLMFGAALLGLGWVKRRKQAA